MLVVRSFTQFHVSSNTHHLRLAVFCNVSVPRHSAELLVHGAAGLLHQRRELAMRILQQNVRMIVFLETKRITNLFHLTLLKVASSRIVSNKNYTHHQTTSVHHEHLIAVHNRVEPMGDGEDSAGCELGAYRALDERIRLWIDVGRRFVQHQHLIVAQDSARQADQLTLTDAVIRTAIEHTILQAVASRHHRVL